MNYSSYKALKMTDHKQILNSTIKLLTFYANTIDFSLFYTIL